MKSAIGYLTYLAYVVMWIGLTVGGLGYVVFWKDASGWWILLSIFCASATYTPDRWAQLGRGDGE